MRIQMNLRFFLLIVTVIGMTIVCAEPEPMVRLTRSEETINSYMQLKRHVDSLINKYIAQKSRHGKRNDVVPMMKELNATWKTLKMIQDAQRQNKQQKQENIRQNKEQILLRDFPSSDADDYTSYDATRSGSLSDAIGKYYDM